MSQLIQIAESGDNETQLDETELRAIAGLVLVAGFETTVNLLATGSHVVGQFPGTSGHYLRQHPSCGRHG